MMILSGFGIGESASFIYLDLIMGDYLTKCNYYGSPATGIQIVPKIDKDIDDIINHLRHSNSNEFKLYNWNEESQFGNFHNYWVHNRMGPIYIVPRDNFVFHADWNFIQHNIHFRKFKCSILLLKCSQNFPIFFR